MTFLKNLSFQEMTRGRASLRALASEKATGKTALIIEPNQFHAEILPGYVHYFNELGYKVTLLWRQANEDDDPFCRFNADEMPRTFVMTPRQMGDFVRSQHADFHGILLSSGTLCIPGGFFGPFVSYAKLSKSIVNRLLIIEHSYVNAGDAVNREIVTSDQIMQLSEYREGSLHYAMINPSYFGTTNNRQAPKKPRRLITVGAVTNRNRSFESLMLALEEVKNFSVPSVIISAVGRGASPELFCGFPQVEAHGFLSFPKLYAEIERADFFLPLLDPNIETHRRYMLGETTGTRQLMLGFLRPAIVHRAFAAALGLSDSSAILYEDGGLAEALRKAIEISDSEYKQMCSSLCVSAQTIAEESKRNLEIKLKSKATARNRSLE